MLTAPGLCDALTPPPPPSSSSAVAVLNEGAGWSGWLPGPVAAGNALAPPASSAALLRITTPIPAATEAAAAATGEPTTAGCADTSASAPAAATSSDANGGDGGDGGDAPCPASPDGIAKRLRGEGMSTGAPGRGLQDRNRRMQRFRVYTPMSTTNATPPSGVAAHRAAYRGSAAATACT